MIPAPFVIAAIVAAVVVGAVAIYAVVALVGSAVKPATEPDDDRGLLERANAIRPPRTFLGRIDRNFEDTVRGTLFGFTSERAVEVLLVVGAVAGVLAFVVTQNWLLAVAAVLAGMLLTVIVFAAFADRRRKAIQEQLPDGCFQLARCLRSGLGLGRAVGESANYSPAPLAPVFQTTANRLAMGMHPGDAFKTAAADVRLTDFDLLAAVIDLHSEVGGDLPGLLDRLAASIRDRNQYRGYARSVTALSRATLTFIALAAPVVLLLYAVLPPEPKMTAAFFASPIGWAMLAAAAVLWLIGLVWSLWLIRRTENY